MVDDRRRDERGSAHQRREASAPKQETSSHGSDAFPLRFGAYSSGASGGLAMSVIWGDTESDGKS